MLGPLAAFIVPNCLLSAVFTAPVHIATQELKSALEAAGYPH
jgi:hypothetical protein